MKSKSLVFGAFTVAILVTGCKQSNFAGENPAISETNSVAVTPPADESGTNAWEKAKETTTNAWASVKEGATNAWADIKDSAQSTADYTYDKKDEFVAKASADLSVLDQKIKELSDKAATASDSVKNEAQTKLQDLHDKRTALDNKLVDVKNASQADWDEMKVGFQTSYDDVKTSLKQTWQWLTDKLSS